MNRPLRKRGWNSVLSATQKSQIRDNPRRLIILRLSYTITIWKEESSISWEYCKDHYVYRNTTRFAIYYMSYLSIMYKFSCNRKKQITLLCMSCTYSSCTWLSFENMGTYIVIFRLSHQLPMWHSLHISFSKKKTHLEEQFADIFRISCWLSLLTRNYIHTQFARNYIHTQASCRYLDQ